MAAPATPTSASQLVSHQITDMTATVVGCVTFIGCLFVAQLYPRRLWTSRSRSLLNDIFVLRMFVGGVILAGLETLMAIMRLAAGRQAAGPSTDLSTGPARVTNAMDFFCVLALVCHVWVLYVDVIYFVATWCVIAISRLIASGSNSIGPTAPGDTSGLLTAAGLQAPHDGGGLVVATPRHRKAIGWVSQLLFSKSNHQRLTASVSVAAFLISLLVVCNALFFSNLPGRPSVEEVANDLSAAFAPYGFNESSAELSAALRPSRSILHAGFDLLLITSTITVVVTIVIRGASKCRMVCRRRRTLAAPLRPTSGALELSPSISQTLSQHVTERDVAPPCDRVLVVAERSRAVSLPRGLAFPAALFASIVLLVVYESVFLKLPPWWLLSDSSGSRPAATPSPVSRVAQPVLNTIVTTLVVATWVASGHVSLIVALVIYYDEFCAVLARPDMPELMPAADVAESPGTIMQRRRARTPTPPPPPTHVDSTPSLQPVLPANVRAASCSPVPVSSLLTAREQYPVVGSQS